MIYCKKYGHGPCDIRALIAGCPGDFGRSPCDNEQYKQSMPSLTWQLPDIIIQSGGQHAISNL